MHPSTGPSGPAAARREAARRTNGEFGAQTRDEAAVDLDVGLSGQPVFVRTTTVSWWRNDQPGPRSLLIPTAVPIVTAEQAPEAISVEDGTTLHSFGGHLYRRHGIYRGIDESMNEVRPGTPEFPVEKHLVFGACDSAADAEQKARERIEHEQFLIVDDIVHIRCPEPRYAVVSSGLPGGRGSTQIKAVTGNDRRLRPSDYFRADDFEAARAHAIALAERRGDLDALPALRAAKPTITIHDPDAVRLVTPARESEEVMRQRETFRSLATNYDRVLQDPLRSSPLEEAEAWERLVAAREALLDSTGDALGHAAAQGPYENRPDTSGR